MCETPVIALTKVAGLIKVNPNPNIAENHACMTLKGFMDVHPGHLFHITIDDFGMVDAQISKHRKIGEVANARKEIVHINE